MAIQVQTPSSYQLPIDRNAVPLQILAPVPATSVNGSIATASARVTLPTSSEIIMIVNTQDMWVKFGDVTVTASAGGASCILFLAGERVIQKPVSAPGSPYTHMAFIRTATDGAVCVTCLN